MSKGRIQSLPTNIVTGIWDPGSDSKDPENVKIVFMPGGRSVMYRIMVEQPRPQLKGPLDNFTKLCIGYERKEK